MSTVVPIYYQIKHTIKGWILNKEFNPGERIPSENELAKKFKVARLTVRQAIFQLAQEGLLIRKRGEGTFVTENHDLLDSFSLEFTGFMDDLFYQVSRSSTKSTTIDRILVPKWVIEKLELSEDTKEVVQIKRLRLLENKPFAYTVNYLPLDIGMRIREGDLRKKFLLEILEEDLRIPLTEAFQTIQASFADQRVSGELGIASGSPILFVERIMYTHRRKPVEMVQSSYRGDFYKYIVRLKKVERKDGTFWIHQSK